MKKSLFLATVFISSIVLAWGATHSEETDVVRQSGKRVVGYLDDSLLPKRWAILRDDAHPEAPRTLVPAGSSSATIKNFGKIKTPAVGQRNVVHAGDRLTLLDDSATLHLQLAAVAIENAMQGETLACSPGAGRRNPERCCPLASSSKTPQLRGAIWQDTGARAMKTKFVFAIALLLVSSVAASCSRISQACVKANSAGCGSLGLYRTGASGECCGGPHTGIHLER